MHSQTVVLMKTSGQLATFKTDLKAVPLIERSTPVKLLNLPPTITVSPRYLLRDDLTTDRQNMSIAFREVFREFNTTSSETSIPTKSKNSLSRTDRISDAFHMGEKLLLSNDNMRPKSRSKTTITSHDIHKVSPCGSDWKHRHANSATTKLHRHFVDDNFLKTRAEVLSPISNKEVKNNNNVQDRLEVTEYLKRGKKLRKRNSCSTKCKQGKHGRMLATATGLLHKRSSVPSLPNSSSTQPIKPSRISSEPPSKVSQTAVLSYTLLDSGNGLAHKHVSNSLIPNNQLHDIYPLRIASAKSNSTTLPSTHYMHDITCNPNPNPIVNDINSIELAAQGQSVLIYKLEMNARIKSASSLKSDTENQASKLKEVSDVSTINTEELSLSAVSCNLQRSNKPSKTVIKYQQKNSHTNQELSLDLVSKESVLNSIYGAVYQTAHQVAAQAEELKKIKKIFLSDRQSGTIRESGMEFPCAPPATPTSDLLRQHEYIPSMSDIRSQRAVKSRLQVMEKEALKKQEKRKEANMKFEKQQTKDRDKLLKAKQRKEIYALNKIMTELENKRFLDFCQAKGLNKV